MNGSDRHAEELDARRLDWALREVVGGRRAPDVTAAVLARAAAGDRGVTEPLEPHAGTSRGRWLLLAAVFVLGLATAFGVGWLRQHDGADDRREAQGDLVRIVTRAAAIASLPAASKAVEVHNLDDAAVAALVARCPDLEHLCVFASTATARPASVGDRAVSITDDALVAIGSLRHLRRLELVGVQHVTGAKLRELERLPLLEHLALTFLDLDDDSLQVLPRLPSLRELDLESNQGFGARGLEAIGACPGLRVLSLAGSGPLRDDWFAPLARLTRLESLNLQAIGLSRRLLFAEGMPAPRTPEFGERGIGVAALQPWPALRHLSLANTLNIESSVGARLARDCPALQNVVLDVCLQIDDGTVADLLSLPQLRSLSVRGCPEVTAASIPRLVTATPLREVHLGKAPWLTLEHAGRLARAGKRVTCERPDDPAFEAALAALTPVSVDRVLRGRVMRDGRPVIGMVAALYAPLERSNGVQVRVTAALATAVAGDDGRFVLAAAVPPGEYELRLEDHRPSPLAGSQPAWVARRAVTIRDGETVPDLDFVLR